MCIKIHRRKPSLFFNIGFITFDNTNNPKCNTKTPRCARGKNIFDMRYIFIPIHHGLYFTCDGLFSWTLLFSDLLRYIRWTITLQLRKQKKLSILHYHSISYVGIVQMDWPLPYSTIQETPPPWWPICRYGGLVLENRLTPPLGASSEGVVRGRGVRILLKLIIERRKKLICKLNNLF